MTVFVVQKGEAYEGRHILAITATHELALGVVWNHISNEGSVDYMFYQYDPSSEEPTGWYQEGWEQWHWRETEPDHWSSGCDRLSVSEVEVISSL